jgi:hypothetical protein
VDAGGGPERDDYGLPRVDVEIPDDARELEPDVQAYRREQRALRRQERSNRLRNPLRREGMALPLLAACLMLALITSTLLVLFAADETGVSQMSRPAATKHPATATPSPLTGQVGQVGQPLVPAMIIIQSGTVQVRNLTRQGPALLALVPPNCDCATALRQLADQAGPEHVATYLIGPPGTMTQLTQLATEAGQSHNIVGDDMNDVLFRAYREHGLSAVLVQTGGSVAFVARGLPQPAQMIPLQAALRQISPVAADH